jgi:hypothetical protein
VQHDGAGPLGVLAETVRAILNPEDDLAYEPDDAFKALLAVASDTLVDNKMQDAHEGWISLMALLQQIHTDSTQQPLMEKIFGGTIDSQVPLRHHVPQNPNPRRQRKGVSLRVDLKHRPLHSTHARIQVTSRALHGSPYAAIGRTGAVDSSPTF